MGLDGQLDFSILVHALSFEKVFYFFFNKNFWPTSWINNLDLWQLIILLGLFKSIDCKQCFSDEWFSNYNILGNMHIHSDRPGVIFESKEIKQGVGD